MTTTASKDLLQDTIAGTDHFYLYVDVPFDWLYHVSSTSVATSTNPTGNYEVEVTFSPTIAGTFPASKRSVAIVNLDSIDFSGGDVSIEVILTDDSSNTSISGGGVIHQQQATLAAKPLHA